MTKKETRTRVYCGPSVRGVARQYTCFTGELPEQMKSLLSSTRWRKALSYLTTR